MQHNLKIGFKARLPTPQQPRQTYSNSDKALVFLLRIELVRGRSRSRVQLILIIKTLNSASDVSF